MSLQFSDTTNYAGILQKYEREIGANVGDVTGNATRLKEVTVDVNLAIDSYLRLAFPAEGQWKLDDTNHTDYPEITTDLVQGQRSYIFGNDANGNLILDVYRVYVKDSATADFVLLEPVDVDTQKDLSSFYDGQNTQGTPTRYDKSANGIFLDPVPDTNVTGGLKVSINREASYFTSTDTTKKPGFPGIHHAYFYLMPAFEYARINSLTSFPRIQLALQTLEREIKEYYSRRAQDVPPTLNINMENNQ